MKRMVMLVFALGVLGLFAATAAAAQVRVGVSVGVWRPPLSGYIVVGSPIGYGPVLIEAGRPHGYHQRYRAYRPVREFERVRVYRPHRREERREGRGRGW
jgi:hypothetical protein